MEQWVVNFIRPTKYMVKENTLSNPDLVPGKDVAYYITEKGKGWVCEVEGRVVGFSIIDLLEKSVWALFVDPDYAEKGIGKELHRLMLDWYFQQTKDKVVLILKREAGKKIIMNY
jgi:GNAT superfamily N-acetyltransferase